MYCNYETILHVFARGANMAGNSMCLCCANNNTEVIHKFILVCGKKLTAIRYTIYTEPKIVNKMYVETVNFCRIP